MGEVWYQKLDKLWIDTLVWVREYLFALILQRQGLYNIEAGTLRNAADFADFFTFFYGEQQTRALGELFKEHIRLLSEIAATMRAGQDYMPLRENFYQNASDLANFLARLNPSWDEAVLKELLQTRYWFEENLLWTLYIQDYQTAIYQYDAAYENVRQISKYIADGLAKEFNLYYPPEMVS